MNLSTPAYLEVLRDFADEHRDAIEADLVEARRHTRNAERFAAETRRRMEGLEYLLSLVPAQRTSDPERMTLHEAMRVAIAQSPAGMLRARDLASEIERLGLYRMNDGRPVEPVQIHARVGNYPHLFRKEGTFIALVDREDDDD